MIILYRIKYQACKASYALCGNIMPDLNDTANVKVSSLGSVRSPSTVGVGGCSQCELQLYVQLGDDCDCTHMARIFPNYWDCVGTEKCLQCSGTWKAIVPSIIPEP